MVAVGPIAAAVRAVLVAGALGCSPTGPDPAAADASSLDPYFRPCSSEAPCPAPYACMTFSDPHRPDAAPRDVCLLPCEANATCEAVHFSCCCNGAGCTSSVGVPGTCACH